MELTSFTNRLGVGQGRLSADSDAFVFVLGDQQHGHLANLVAGDSVGLVQEVDLTTVDLIRVEGSLRVPSSLPDGLSWHASILVGGGRLATLTCPPGRIRPIRDLAANVSKWAGVQTVELRLELLAT